MEEAHNPGAVQFANYCVENGVALFYVTNRYDQGYKVSEAGYAGQQGYQKPDGTVIGSSTYDIFGKTMYDLTMESMEKWGTQWIVFPNAVYGSAANYAMQYGFSALFDYFDYTNGDSEAWELYQ